MLIKNIKIYPVTKEIIESGYIYIEGKTIVKIGPMKDLLTESENNLRLKNEVIIDGQGLTAYPGFVDAHSHLGLWEDSTGIEGEDGNEENDPSTPQLRVIDGVNPMDRGFRDALRAGVTSVVVAPGSANPIGGQIVALKTFGARVDDMIIKEPVGIKFALGENPKRVYGEKSELPSTRMATAAIIREKLQKAKRYMHELDYTESDEGYDEPDYDFKCEALIPLLKREIQAHFHVHRADDIFTAIRLAKEFNLEYVLVHATDAVLISNELKEENSKIITGPLLCDRSKLELKNLGVNIPVKLSEAGLDVAIATDHPVVPEEYLPLCVALAINSGLDHFEALKSITINPSKICGLDDKIGSLEEGKDADIVLFDKDPFLLGSVPKIVIVNGQQVI